MQLCKGLGQGMRLEGKAVYRTEPAVLRRLEEEVGAPVGCDPEESRKRLFLTS